LKFFHISYILVFLFGTSFAQAREVFRLELDKTSVDDQFRKTQAIIPVFKYTGQPFEGISDFGLKTSKKQKPETFEIKFPDMTGMKDTSYTYLFFGGNTQSPPIGYVFCIIGNNSRYDGPTYIWIDRNLNLDLSDDGKPDVFLNNVENDHEIKLYNPTNKNAYHTIRLTRFEFHKNMPYKKLVDDHYHKNAGNKVFAGTDYSFREQRLNIRAADFKHGQDSFRIALKDVNCNGIFSDVEFDQVLIGKYGQEELGEIIFEQDKKSNGFERNLKRYTISHIDPAGRYIAFYYDSTSELTRQLLYCKKIPKFKVFFPNAEVKSKKIRKYKKKPVFLVFWNLSNPTLKDDTAALSAIHREFGDKIHVIALNYGDSPGKVEGWVLRNKIPYTVGMASKDILDMYFVETIPATFFTNKKQRLCEINLTSQELLAQLRVKYPK